jgi:putative restriction endonuclease
MIGKYLQMFANLRTDRGRDRYPKITYHRAPHKPFLLLSVMDLIAQGKITENLIEPSFELVDTIRRKLLNGVTGQGYAKRFIGGRWSQPAVL